MSLFAKIKNCVFQNYSCFLYSQTLVTWNEADFQPKIKNYSFHLVTSSSQLNGLIADGFDLLHFQKEIRKCVEGGAVAGLIFISKELASMEWVAITRQAAKTINLYPLKIDFERGEAYASGVWTNPKFRQKGLHVYIYYKVYEFLRQRGVASVLSIVATDNFAAQKAHQRFFPHENIYGRARYVRILGIPFWSESSNADMKKISIL